jgi:hypothetical protein
MRHLRFSENSLYSRAQAVLGRLCEKSGNSQREWKKAKTFFYVCLTSFLDILYSGGGGVVGVLCAKDPQPPHLLLPLVHVLVI